MREQIPPWRKLVGVEGHPIFSAVDLKKVMAMRVGNVIVEAIQ
jgi:hypothetical protein